MKPAISHKLLKQTSKEPEKAAKKKVQKKLVMNVACNI